MNLRTRSALDRKTPKAGFQAGFIWNSMEASQWSFGVRGEY